MTTTLVATVGQKFAVAGMTCGHCEMAVTAELSKLEGVALPGLAAADDGLRLIADIDTQQLGIETPYRFRIVDEDGPVTAFDVEHTKRMHLIVVRRDFVGFQ